MINPDKYKYFTPENILCHELIGLTLKVVKSTDPTKVGVVGKIIDETKNTFKIQTKKKIVVLPKKESSFEIILPNNVHVGVAGKIIAFRHSDRTKKVAKLLGWYKCRKF
jgi:ribonuclease P protein subunit POP4